MSMRGSLSSVQIVLLCMTMIYYVTLDANSWEQSLLAEWEQDDGVDNTCCGDESEPRTVPVNNASKLNLQ